MTTLRSAADVDRVPAACCDCPWSSSELPKAAPGAFPRERFRALRGALPQGVRCMI